MAKKQVKTLSEAEIFYVQEKSKNGMTADEIATVLNCQVDDIVTYLYKKPKGPTKTFEAFKTKSDAQGNKGVTVMTQTASMLGDELKSPPTGRDMSRFVTTTKQQ